MDLAEFTDVAYALALEGVEVGGDARVFKVDDAGERLVEEGPDGLDGEVASFGLEEARSGVLERQQMNEGVTARVWIMALKPRSTLPLPMISVTSCAD